MFADDVKLYSRIDTTADTVFLQQQLANLCCWSAKWRLNLNPSKCKVLTITLRRAPILSMYAIGGEQLERVTVMRDLGVFLDEKLTFSDHVDVIVRKANRVLGMLMRSFQTGKRGRSLRECNRKAVMAAYCANVRSILEFAGVVWGGAAEVHMKRVERVQHKFLTWLCARCLETGVSFEYDALLSHYGLASLAARRAHHDIVFIRNVHRHAVDSPFLLEKFPLAVPPRPLRNRILFHVPYARVNSVKNGPFCRMPKMCNAFLDRHRDIDIWNSSALLFKKHVIIYVRDE